MLESPADYMTNASIQTKIVNLWAIQVSSVFLRLAGKVDASIEKHFWRWATLLLVPLLICSIEVDVRLKMWADELFTFYVATQPSLAEIMKATAEGADGQPPLYAMIVHSILPILQTDALAVRLPSTIGCYAMVLCLLAFLLRRLPATYSLFASLLAFCECLYFSTEGRSYGIVLGCAAGALLCWQMAVDGRLRRLAIVLLGFCSALLVAFHYYAIFFLVPVFLAEIFRSHSRGKLDLPVLFAMAPALLVLGLHYSLIETSKQFQEHFWSPAHLGMIQELYARNLPPFLELCSIALVATVVFPKTSAVPREDRPGFASHELVAVCGLALMPAVAIFISTYSTHVFVERYVLWAEIGFALLAAAVLFTAARGQVAIGVVLLGLVISSIAKQDWTAVENTAMRERSEGVYTELEALPAGPELIIVPNSNIFLELSYYATPPLRRRLVYPLNRELDLHYLGNDTGPLLLSPLGRRAPIRVENYDDIISENRHFLLATIPQDYLPRHLIASGYRVVPIGTAATLYQVEAPKRQ